VAPIAVANVSVAAIVNAGLPRKRRSAYKISRMAVPT
jgi:hypothetical protein